MRHFRETHREELKNYHKEYGGKYYLVNKQKLSEQRRKRKEERYKVDLAGRKRLKVEVLGFYSNGVPKCAHCETEELVVLCLDHVNGGGRREREKVGIGGGINFLRWLKLQDYPLGYQVLCYNCNARKSFSQLPAFKA